MAVNLAEKYSAQLDQVFTKESYTDKFVNNKYDFDGVKTVNVFTVTTVPLTNYDRTDTGDRFGGNNELQDTVKAYTLTNDKSFKITIDNGNLKQQMLAKRAGTVLQAQMREQVVPEIDKDRLATVATGANTATQKITTAGKSYEEVLAMNAYLDEQKAPIDGRILAVTPGFYNLIKKDIVTTMSASGYSDKLVGRGFVGELDGIPVVKIPTSYFPAKTQALLWHKDALLGAKQITKTKIITDSELVDGSVLIGRFIYGNFILDSKKKCVASIVTA